jgi:ADP-ribose pyrophosphatase
MADREAYRALVQARPELFRNPDGAGFAILLGEAEIRQAEQHIAERLQKHGAPEEWAEVGVAFRDQYVLLLRDAVRFTDGSLGTYIRMVSPEDCFPGVVILPVWQGKVLLIRHFRHATRGWHLEIPRGFGVDRDAEVSARRELTEEIGAADIRLMSLGGIYPDAGADSSQVSMFYAEVGSYCQPEVREALIEL